MQVFSSPLSHSESLLPVRDKALETGFFARWRSGSSEDS